MVCQAEKVGSGNTAILEIALTHLAEEITLIPLGYCVVAGGAGLGHDGYSERLRARRRALFAGSRSLLSPSISVSMLSSISFSDIN